MHQDNVLRVILLSIIVISGCNGYQVIPERLEGRISKNVSFVQIRDDPAHYRGKLVVVGGKVLSWDQQEKMTRIEVLQLPLSDKQQPLDQKTTSKGRFLAICSGKNIFDPKFLPPETPVTIVGEVRGSTTLTIENKEKDVPLFVIKDLTIWDINRHGGHWFIPGNEMYYSPLYVPYEYRPSQWSDCEPSSE